MSSYEQLLGFTPTRELMLAKLSALFPANEHSAVLAALDAFESDDPHGRARVQLAVLKLSAGRAESVPSLVQLAKLDYRDVLAPAEYPRQDAHGFASLDALSETERQRLVQEDRAQYLAWLRS
ncbi:MAG TPA: hypothetical protein VJW73_10395 [Gemmatimonadaceae bacterium]|nr:hypothetical protein [Gemmatimonadaceae bacterium]